MIFIDYRGVRIILLKKCHVEITIIGKSKVALSVNDIDKNLLIDDYRR